MKDEHIKRKAAETLESMGQIRRTEPDPYFATRILAKWQREQEEAVQPSGAWKWQLALAVILLVVNAWAILPKWVNTTDESEYYGYIAADYGIAFDANNLYDYSEEIENH